MATETQRPSRIERTHNWWSLDDLTHDVNDTRTHFENNTIHEDEIEQGCLPAQDVWSEAGSVANTRISTIPVSTSGKPEKPKKRSSNSRYRHIDPQKWIAADQRNGFIRVYSPGSHVTNQLIPCTTDTTANKICMHLSIPTHSLHVQYNGDTVRRVDQYTNPLALQNDFLFLIGYNDPRRVQKLGTSAELGYLIRFYAGKLVDDGTFTKENLQNVLEVRKGKVINSWVKRMCVICGTNLYVYKGADKTGSPETYYLVSGRIDTVVFPHRELCIKLTCVMQSEKSVTICFRNEAEFDKWMRRIKKATTKLPSSADLSHSNLENIPETLFTHSELENLNLRHNILRQKPKSAPATFGGWIDDLSRFHRLTSLNMSDNNLRIFPRALCELTSLVELNVSSNKITDIPEEISQLVNIEALHIHNNSLVVLPERITGLKRLSVLVLAFNRFVRIPDQLCRMTDNNENIIMAGNQVTNIDVELIGRMRGVKRIDLRMNSLILSPSETAHFSEFTHLTHLDVRDNLIDVLDIRSVTSLQYLNCERNNIYSLHVNGTSLKTLIATQNKIETVNIHPKPEWLEHFNLTRNKLVAIPPDLPGCVFLEKLLVGDNKLTELPERLFAQPNSRITVIRANRNMIQSLPNICAPNIVEELNLSSNYISQFPANFLECANKLRILNVSRNRLISLPSLNQVLDKNKVQEAYLSFNCLTNDSLEIISGYQRLKVLHLAHNRLTELDGRLLSSLEMLTELNVSGNALTVLPGELARHPSLVILRAHSNALRELPADLSHSPALQVLDLGCNQLLCVDSMRSLMDSHLKLIDVSCNLRVSVSMQDLSSIKNKRKICLVDMTGENRHVPGSPPPGIHKSFHLPFMAGLAETAGNRNKLCVSVIKKPAFPTPDSAVYAMFDGGYNNLVPKLLQSCFGEVLVEEMRHCRDDATVMKYTMLTCHKRLKQNGQRLGAASAVCYLKKTGMSDDKFLLHVSNVGDVEVVLSQGGEPLVLSRLFRATDDVDDRKRVCMTDGVVTEDGKVNGTTHCTRLIGCGYMFPQMIPDPYVVQTTLTPADDCVIIGNKNLWNYVSYEEAVSEVKRIAHPVVAAKRVMDLAQSYGSNENISVLVIKCRIGQPEQTWDVDEVSPEYKRDAPYSDDEGWPDEVMSMTSSMRSIQTSTTDSWQPRRFNLPGAPPPPNDKPRMFLKRHEIDAIEGQMKARLALEVKRREIGAVMRSMSADAAAEGADGGQGGHGGGPDSEEDGTLTHPAAASASGSGGDNWSTANPTPKNARKMDAYLGQAHKSLTHPSSAPPFPTFGGGTPARDDIFDLGQDRVGDAAIDPSDSELYSDPGYARLKDVAPPPGPQLSSRIIVHNGDVAATSRSATRDRATARPTTANQPSPSSTIAVAAVVSAQPPPNANTPEPVAEPVYAQIKSPNTPPSAAVEYETQEVSTDIYSSSTITQGGSSSEVVKRGTLVAEETVSTAL